MNDWMKKKKKMVHQHPQYKQWNKHKNAKEIAAATQIQRTNNRISNTDGQEHKFS